MSLRFETDFWDRPGLRAELIRFIRQIHNLDLTRWEQLGYWDRNYRPFSYFDGDRMVANACLYSMNMRINGQDCRVAQISGVGTDPEFRRQGLAHELNTRAMQWARETAEADQLFFLFADTEALRLYQTCGFRRVVEHKSRIRVEGRRRSGNVRKLDTGNREHLDLIDRIARNRTPASNRLGVHNPELLMFWCLSFLAQNVCFVEALDLLVLMGREDGLLTISDIVGRQMPAFSDLYPHIAAPSDTQVEFLFMPDRLKLDRCEAISLGLERGTHLCGEFSLEGEAFIIPATAMA